MNKIRRGLAASVIAALGVLGLAGSPAQAATVITAQLSISPNPPPGPGVFNVKVFVKVPMSQEDAEGYLGNGARIEVRFMGDDPGTDSVILGPVTFVRSSTGLSVGPEGIRLHFLSQEAGGSFLNEDDSWGNRVDEVYVNARFVDATGATIRTNSNLATGLF
ncbi:hypothetical protein Aph01nite_40380 [Acrocarpospora phusangensis]|uniref:PLAT domain-containing protein n=1 Tax=Acrocarpospora phusangensis TaxID=1070424 RepID=A0A919UPU9_9ACTN|nr:hypothetical protein [Acrocarpospora phusangensis]GIH25728.1 hypothetical protein Aph01nite_40380 [Acrocarpospora phusangensis]